MIHSWAIGRIQGEFRFCGQGESTVDCLDSDLKTFRSYSIAANSYSSKLSSITTASSIIKSGNVLCNVAKPPNANSSVTSYFHPIVVTVMPSA